MTLKCIAFVTFLILVFPKNAFAQNNSDHDQDQKASKWVSSLKLRDNEKIESLEKIISNHLKLVRDYHNSHPYTEVPNGINPKNGDQLSELDRRIIAHSAKPKAIHEKFMSGLRKHLSEKEVIQILDKYTVGKVDFTMKGYHAIVPDLKEEEAVYIRKLLESAREQSIDYKNMEEISAIFEIYKTKAEQYLNSNGRDWHQLYKDYVNRNSSECIRNIDLAAAFSHGILQSILRFLSESAVTVAIVIFLALYILHFFDILHFNLKNLEPNNTQYRQDQKEGHYESYFQRANHPSKPLAFWIRYTLFSPRGNPFYKFFSLL